MKLIKQLSFFILLIISMSSFAQQTVLQGVIMADDEVGSIHVINKTQNLYAVSDAKGLFAISAKLNDTITITGVQYKHEKIVVSRLNIESKTFIVKLELEVNALDEVVIGRILTGDLMADINNTTEKPAINFYDVGIPGYTGKPKTQTQRRLQEASGFSPSLGGSTGGVGGSISMIAVINAISGRTKYLKELVKLETSENYLDIYKIKFSKNLFAENPLEESKRNEFFYFVADDLRFLKTCKTKNEFVIFEFFKSKLQMFKKRLKVVVSE